MSKTRQIVCTCTTETAFCVALQTEPIDENISADLSAGFKALGDPHRVAVVHLLSAASGPVCVIDGDPACLVKEGVAAPVFREVGEVDGEIFPPSGLCGDCS